MTKKLNTLFLIVSLLGFHLACKKAQTNQEQDPLIALPAKYLEGTPFNAVVKTNLKLPEISKVLISANANGIKITNIDENNVWVYTTKSNSFKVYLMGVNLTSSSNKEEIEFITVTEYLKTGLKEISRNIIKNSLRNGKILNHEYYKYDMRGSLIGGAFINDGKVNDAAYPFPRTELHNCYMSYSACVNSVYNGYTSDNLGQVLAEWLPVRTMANISCGINYQEGYIYGGSGFDFLNCGTIYL